MYRPVQRDIERMEQSSFSLKRPEYYSRDKKLSARDA